MVANFFIGPPKPIHDLSDECLDVPLFDHRGETLPLFLSIGKHTIERRAFPPLLFSLGFFIGVEP